MTALPSTSSTGWTVAGGGGLARRVEWTLSLLDELRPASRPVSRLAHSLQVADKARLAGANDQFQVAALCHDIGHLIPLCDHAEVAARLLNSFVDARTVELIRWHEVLGQGGAAPPHVLEWTLARQFVRWDIESWSESPGPVLSDYSATLRRVFDA